MVLGAAKSLPISGAQTRESMAELLTFEKRGEVNEATFVETRPPLCCAAIRRLASSLSCRGRKGIKR